jgi:hypothetical protein
MEDPEAEAWREPMWPQQERRGKEKEKRAFSWQVGLSLSSPWGEDQSYFSGFEGVGLGVGFGLLEPSFPGGFGGSGSSQTAPSREAGAIRNPKDRMAKRMVFMVSRRACYEFFQ